MALKESPPVGGVQLHLKVAQLSRQGWGLSASTVTEAPPEEARHLPDVAASGLGDEDKLWCQTPPPKVKWGFTACPLCRHGQMSVSLTSTAPVRDAPRRDGCQGSRSQTSHDKARLADPSVCCCR